MHTRDWIWFGLAWLLFIIVINPIGEFPLNDDWGYAKVVKHLIETGEYQPGTWPVMTIFTQVIWGALFAGVFGFSFTILRISTLVLAILGSYWIFRESLRLSGDRYWAWVVLFCLVLNPLYFNLSFTFMTDVPFTVGIIGAFLLYRRALQNDNNWYWMAACLLTAAATLIRQPALLLAPAFGLTALLKRPGWKSAIWALGGTALVYGALLWYVYFMSPQGETPGAPHSLMPMLRRLRFPLIWELLTKRGGMILFYMAVMLFPILFLRSTQIWKVLKTRRRMLLLGLAGATTLLFAIHSWNEIPAGNIISFFGLGPTPMVGIDNRYFENSNFPYIIWPLLRAGGYFTILLLLFFFYDRISRIHPGRKMPVVVYWKLGLVFFILAYGLYLLLDRYHFDRYQLALLPAMVFLLTPQCTLIFSRWTQVSVMVFLILMGLFSVGATRDYLNWNRTRWSVLHNMIEESGISPHQIDGGLEFNGWYTTAPQGPFSFEHKSWWFVDEDQYVLSFSKSLSCTVSSTAYPVTGWWPGKDTLYVHERPAIMQRDTIYSDLEQLAADGTQLHTNIPGLTLPDAGQRVTKRAHSGQHAYFLTPEHPYAGKISLQPVKPCEAVTITAWRLGNDRSAGIVASAPDADAFHTFQNIFTENPESDGWHRIRHEVRLPEDYPSDQLDIYLWNPVNDSIWMDDVQVIWRQIE